MANNNFLIFRRLSAKQSWAVSKHAFMLLPSHCRCYCIHAALTLRLSIALPVGPAEQYKGGDRKLK
jgi:hypothetical protein